MHALLLLSLRSLPPEFKMSLSASLSATSLIGIGQAPSLIARSDPEPIGIAPFLPISRSSCPFSSSTDIIFMEYDSLSRCLGGEMVDTRDSKSRAKERGGSSPLQGIILRMLIELE
ncbi:hypothetical protein Pint_34147 [Pistacia integerrima]|uniref:Uncharacterized protein n=1 Tax=Pistacia integerrima TaxID=434235 RepID=A0ACC0X3A7_9ROSI|nr:hypothetical protein Pint_34147 [Pistacia integerrima]